MTNEELLAQIDAAYDVERVRSTALRTLAVMVGDKECRGLWRMAWIQGHQAGLAAAKEIFNEETTHGL